MTHSLFMISRPTLVAVFSFAAVLPLSAQQDGFRAPDSIVLKNGHVVHGLIIKNSKDSVLIQERYAENIYPKSEIVRIRDEADIGPLYTDIHRHGELPPWRVIANDLRTHDEIRSLVEIPATLIDNGEFRNVPYKSFRINNNIELNIYGDPENPAGVELGIYGPRLHSTKLRKSLRAYLAGYLTSRDEVAALYSLNLNGGVRDVGDLTLEITPHNAPDAYGAWWISLYSKEALNDARLSDAEYDKLVRPFREVVGRRGRVIANGWTDDQTSLSNKLQNLGDSAKVLLRGFYRDKKGDFHLIADKATLPPKAN